MFRSIVASTIVVVLLAASASATDVRISITNEGNSDFFLTPLWYGFHDGTFDLFDPGSQASAGLQLIAEEGDASTLMTAFANAPGTPGNFQGVITSPGGVDVAPVIDPGETASTTITPANPAAYRFFSFASMVIPSNDAFIGNGNPTGYEVFDAAGSFNGPVTISILGSNIWDAGTEANTTFGAAFSTIGGDRTDEGGTVALLGAGGLDNFAGTGFPIDPANGVFGTIGTDASALIQPGDVLATITISQVPEPASLVLLGMVGAVTGVARRSRS